MVSLAGIFAATLLAASQIEDEAATQTRRLQVNTYGLYTIETSVGRPLQFAGATEAGPVPFIIDTAASHTAVPRIIAEQLARDELISLDEVGHGLTGPFDTSRIFVDQLDFGLGPREVEIAIFDESDGSVMSAAGLLGANAFGGDGIRIDFPRRRLDVLQHPFSGGARGLSVRNGLIVGEARVHGVEGPVQVLIDTGATASIANTALAEARGGTVRVGDNLVAGVSGSEVQAEVRKLFSRFQLDNLCMGLFQITVLDVYAFDRLGWTHQPAMILGMDVLHDAVITVDYGTRNVAIDGVDERACRTMRNEPGLSVRVE